MLNFFKKHSRFWTVIASVVITIIIFVFRNNLTQLQGYGYFGLFVLSILGNATIILPAPVFLTAFVGGAIFNPLIVAIITSFGASIGELTGYLAGYGAEDLLIKDLRLLKLKKYMDKYGLWTLFVLALIPNPLFDLAGITAGATNMSVKKYFAVVWVGKLIKFGIIAYLGSRSIILLDKYI